MPSQYVTVQIAPEAREVLRRWQLQLSLEADKRLSLGDAIRAAIAVAEHHRSEAVAALTSD